MKCLICSKFCLATLCDDCLDSIPLQPSVREVNGIRVYCFFAYSDIDFLLKSKYYAIGSKIYSALGKIAGEYFFGTMGRASVDLASHFDRINIIGIDDCVRSFYSHTGVLVREFARAGKKARKKSNNLQKLCNIKPIYGELKATNQVSYAGKSLAFRQANKRGLRLSDRILKSIKSKLDSSDNTNLLKNIAKKIDFANNDFIKNDFVKSNFAKQVFNALDFFALDLKKLAKQQNPKSSATIIVDDIITTGTSFGEAIEVCQKENLQVLFCLCLCNAAL
ncbi:phosphoribosyltransferase [Helicobacter sp. T3_23-1056]